MALGFVQSKKDLPASMDLDTMARLCGRSVLRLPPEYANAPLVLPTCLRAMAHYLSQHGEWRERERGCLLASPRSSLGDASTIAALPQWLPPL
jgi:hypothetical protein